jgi:predicted TIM-barrel fold metal-dependent hydrolase
MIEPSMQIDAYAHIVPPRFAERVERHLERHGVPERIKLFDPWLHEDEVLVDLDARKRLLEPYPDYRQVLVLGVFPVDELGPPSLTVDLAKQANDEMAELVRADDRFLGYAAALPLNDVDASLAEIDERPDATGILLHTNIGGAPLDDRRFEPIFARAHERDIPIWLHPTRSPIWPDYLTEKESKYGIWWSLGWPYETAVAMTRLVYSGCMERYPDLKVITHHAGGMIPHFSGRLDTIQAEDQRHAFEHDFKKPALDYFRQFYVDTAMFGAPHAVRCALEFFGPSQVLFGTDMPLGGPAVIEDTITDLQGLNLEPQDEHAVFEGNARRILKL